MDKLPYRQNCFVRKCLTFDQLARVSHCTLQDGLAARDNLHTSRDKESLLPIPLSWHRESLACYPLRNITARMARRFSMEASVMLLTDRTETAGILSRAAFAGVQIGTRHQISRECGAQTIKNGTRWPACSMKTATMRSPHLL